jgi:hypothetical protein
MNAPVVVRPPVPHFPHAAKPKETTKPAVKKELTEEEKLHYQDVLSKRIRDAMKQKIHEKKQEENSEKQKKEKLEKFHQDYQIKLQEQKRALKAKKKEERKQKKLEQQLQKSLSAGNAEKEDDDEELDSEEENEDPAGEKEGQAEGKEKKVLFTKKFISSAPEIFENLLEDFEFEEFISKPSLLQLYSPTNPDNDEKKQKENEDEDSLPAPALSANHFPSSASPKNKNAIAFSSFQQSKEEEKKASSYKINRSALRVPKSLKDTPYFQHYVKHTHLKQKETKKKIVGGADHHENHWNKETEKTAKHHEDEKQEAHLSDEEEEINPDSLLEMIMKAQEKKYQHQQQHTTTKQQNSLDLSSHLHLNPSSCSVVHQRPSKETYRSHSTMTSLSTLQMEKLPVSSVAPHPSLKLPKFQPTFNLSSMPSAPTLPTSSSFVPSNDSFPKENDNDNNPDALSHQTTTVHTSSSPALSSLPVPDLSAIQNIKARYGISLFDFGSKQSQNNNLMMFGGGTSNQQQQHHNHMGIMKKLKMKKVKKSSSKKEKEKENEEKEKKPAFLQKRSSARALLNDKIVKEVGTSPTDHDNQDKDDEDKEENMMLRLSKRTSHESHQSLRYSSLPLSTYEAASKVSFKDSFPLQDNGRDEEDEEEEDASLPFSSTNGNRKSNKVREKISELIDYEDQLQKDYEILRNQFTNRLQQITKENQQTMKSASLSSLKQSIIEGEGAAPTSLSIEQTNDPLRKSVTESYMRESSGRGGGGGGRGVSASQNKVTTKELLMEWALEDAIENGEITDGEIVAHHTEKNKKYYDNDEEEEESEDDEGGDYEEEEGDYDHDEEEDEEYPDDHNEQPALVKKEEVTYDDDSYYDRYLSSLHDEVIHRNSSSDVVHEEEGEDADEDHRAMRSERKGYWKKVVSGPPAAATGERKADLDDDTCLDMMKALSTKIKSKK